MSETKWIQGKNNVNIVGTVAENKLEIKEFKDKRTNAPYNALVGYLNVKVDENEIHQVNVFAKQHTKDGAESKLFKGLNTIRKEVVSIADKANAVVPEEVNPSKVSVFGTFEDNSYFKGEELVSNTRIKGINVSRIDGQPNEPKATFEVQGWVTQVQDEMDSEGFETGRKKVTLLIPDFKPDTAEVGRIVPISIVVPEGQGADYIEEEFQNGSSVLMIGEIVNFRKVTTKETEMGFGNAKVEEKVEYKREYLAHSGLAYEEDEENHVIFDSDLMKKAQVQYNIQLEENRSEKKTESKPKGGFGFGSETSTSSEQKKVENLF